MLRADACDVLSFQGLDQVMVLALPLIVSAALSGGRAEELLGDANNVAELFYEDLKETNVSHTLTSVCERQINSPDSKCQSVHLRERHAVPGSLLRLRSCPGRG